MGTRSLIATDSLTQLHIHTENASLKSYLRITTKHKKKIKVQREDVSQV